MIQNPAIQGGGDNSFVVTNVKAILGNAEVYDFEKKQWIKLKSEDDPVSIVTTKFLLMHRQNENISDIYGAELYVDGSFINAWWRVGIPDDNRSNYNEAITMNPFIFPDGFGTKGLLVKLLVNG